MSKAMYIEKKKAFDMALKSIGDAWLADKTCSAIPQAVSIDYARMIAKTGINIVVSDDGIYPSTVMNFRRLERKLTYITKTKSIEETYDEFGCCVSRKVFDAEGVRVWQENSRNYAYNKKAIFDDEGVRVACAAG